MKAGVGTGATNSPSFNILGAMLRLYNGLTLNGQEPYDEKQLCDLRPARHILHRN